jgi:hypothetical protein
MECTNSAPLSDLLLKKKTLMISVTAACFLRECGRRVGLRNKNLEKERSMTLQKSLPTIEQEVENYKLKVENHLRRMGFDWEVVTSKCQGVVS